MTGPGSGCALTAPQSFCSASRTGVRCRDGPAASAMRQPGRVEPCRVRCPCLGQSHHRPRRGGPRPAARQSVQLANPSEGPAGGPPRGAGHRRLRGPGHRQPAHRSPRRRPPPGGGGALPRPANHPRPLRRPLRGRGAARPGQPRSAGGDGHDRRSQAARAARRGSASTPRPWRRCSRPWHRPSRRTA